MYLMTYISSPETLFANAFQKPKAKAIMSDDQLMRLVYAALETDFLKSCTDEVLVDISDAVAMYETRNGKYDQIQKGDEGQRARDEYEAGIDDAMERVVEPYLEYLSQDWLGRNTIDTEAWDEDRMKALAGSVAREVWKQINHDRTPAQVLANAGIVAETMASAITQFRQGDMPMNTPTEDDFAATIARMRKHLGADPDLMTVYEDLETLLEDDGDELLVQSAALRLGLGVAEASVLQVAAMEMAEPVDEVLKALQDAPEPARKETRARKADKPTAPVEGAVSASVLATLKDMGAGDTVTAEAMGVSRSTYTNWCNGKTPFTPNENQYDYLRGQMVDRANRMLAALAELDGTEPVVVA